MSDYDTHRVWRGTNVLTFKARNRKRFAVHQTEPKKNCRRSSPPLPFTIRETTGRRRSVSSFSVGNGTRFEFRIRFTYVYPECTRILFSKKKYRYSSAIFFYFRPLRPFPDNVFYFTWRFRGHFTRSARARSTVPNNNVHGENRTDKTKRELSARRSDE